MIGRIAMGHFKQSARSQVRNVTHCGNQLVVPAWCDLDRFRAEQLNHGSHSRERHGVGRSSGSKDPGGAAKHVRRRSERSRLFRPCHRVAADESFGQPAPRILDRLDDGVFHRPHVGDERLSRCQNGQRCISHRGHRNADDDQIARGEAIEIIDQAMDGADAACFIATLWVSVKAQHLGTGSGHTEPDGGSNQSEAHDPDGELGLVKNICHSGKSSRSARAAPRYTWWMSAGARSVSTCIITRIHSGIDPRTFISRAHISGTSPRPIARAAVAGNSLRTSSVAVKKIEMIESCANEFRSIMARTNS